MTHDLASSIESFLLVEPGNDGWLPVKVVVERFSLPTDRVLRADGKIPGPLSRCVISSPKGLKHLSRATVRERIAFKNKIKRELISRVRAFRWHEEGIARCLEEGFEIATGQRRLLP